MLKSGDVEYIKSTFARLRREVDSIIKQCIELTWYMRGAIQYKDMLEMTYYEKQMISDFISSRFDEMKKNKSAFPVY